MVESSSDVFDKDLIPLIRQGDSYAFQKLYHAYQGFLFMHAYHKLGDKSVAMDLVQDLFASIWENREAINIKNKVSTYLYSAMRYKIIDVINKEENKKKYLSSLKESMDSVVAYEASDYLVREKMLEQQIEMILDKLSPRVRQVFILSRKHYLSHKEIAKELNLSEHSVRSYIKEALKVFKSKLRCLPWILIVYYCKYF